MDVKDKINYLMVLQEGQANGMNNLESIERTKKSIEVELNIK